MVFSSLRKERLEAISERLSVTVDVVHCYLEGRGEGVDFGSNVDSHSLATISWSSRCCSWCRLLSKEGISVLVSLGRSLRNWACATVAFARLPLAAVCKETAGRHRPVCWDGRESSVFWSTTTPTTRYLYSTILKTVSNKGAVAILLVGLYPG